MACQGCGRTSDNRLCCPTCIEFGRSSFFCGQACFTKNWAAHNQLHELMRRKRALANRGDDGTDKVHHNADPNTRVGGSTGSEAKVGDSTGHMPLAGGTSMMNLSAQSRGITTLRSAGGTFGAEESVPSDSGVLSGLIGQAKAATDVFSKFGNSHSVAGKNRSRSPACSRISGAASGRSTSRSREGSRISESPRRAKLMNVQLSLWAIVFICLTAAFLFYRAHERYSNQPSAPEALPPPKPMTPSADSGFDSEVEVSRDVASPAAARVALSPLDALRAEVSDLRGNLQRHEQMLRYIMDRYVERNEVRNDTALGIIPVAAHEAAVVNFSAPEFTSKSYAKDPDDQDILINRETDMPRKRKGGGDAVGMPALER